MLSAKATSTKNETDKKKDTRKTVYFDDEKRSQFRELLLDLSKSRELQEHFTQISERLETFYFSDDQKIKYHHYYADIFSTLTEIQNEDSKERTLEFLGSNLQYIRDNYKPIKNVSVNSSLNYSTHSPRILKGVISMFQGSSLFQSSAV